MSDSPLGIGVIGCGVRIRNILDQLIQHATEPQPLRIVALSDPSDASIEAAKSAFNPDAHVYHDYRELVQDPAVDWVYIGSWNRFHRDHAVAALEAGKHVFCEKPLATTFDDALAIRDAHAAGDRQFCVGFTLRYAPLYRRIRQLMDEGQIGELISFEFNETLHWTHGGFIFQDWRRHTADAGTHLLEKCCHDVDLANWFVGARASRVAGFGGRRFFVPENTHHMQRLGQGPRGEFPFTWGRPQYGENAFTADGDLLDHQVAIFEYANAVRCTFHSNACAGIPERRMYLVGSEGAIRADLVAGQVELQQYGWDTPRHLYGATGGGHGGGDEVMARELLECMFDGAAPKASVKEGLESAVTVFAVDRATAEGCVVDVSDYWAKVDAGQPQGV